MIFYDIHTHHKGHQNKSKTSILNYEPEDINALREHDCPEIYCSLGLHPWKVKEENWQSMINLIEEKAENQYVKAIGECGLDKLAQTPMALQQQVFIAQVQISEKRQKPLIIHCVKAFDELIAIKRQLNPQQIWIIHGFRGKPQQALQLFDEGVFLSIGPKHNTGAIKIIPIERLFLETDDSGQTIESVYNKIAAILKIPLAVLSATISLNIQKLIQI